MKRKALFLLLIISSQIIFSSCATIFTGSRQNVTIDSDVPDTRVEVGGMYQGTTPTSVRLKKGFTGETVVLKKEGYENKVIQPPTDFNPVSVLNLFNILFWAIDVATGAMMKYTPDYIEVKMEPIKDR
ncbi:PEGA domain-containing protein [Peijinzhouia sedimentorum]